MAEASKRIRANGNCNRHVLEALAGITITTRPKMGEAAAMCPVLSKVVMGFMRVVSG
jgi:hypothetical protein